MARRWRAPRCQTPKARKAAILEHRRKVYRQTHPPKASSPLSHFHYNVSMPESGNDKYIDMSKHPILWGIIFTAKLSWILLVYFGPFVIFFWFVFTIISNMNT